MERYAGHGTHPLSWVQMVWSCPICNGHGPHGFLCNLQQNAVVIQKPWTSYRNFYKALYGSKRISLGFFVDVCWDSLRISLVKDSEGAEEILNDLYKGPSWISMWTLRGLRRILKHLWMNSMRISSKILWRFLKGSYEDPKGLYMIAIRISWGIWKGFNRILCRFYLFNKNA